MGLLCCFPGPLNLLSWVCRELIYPRNLPAGTRNEASLPKPSQFGISDYEDLHIPTPDGESLHAFLIRPSNRAARTRMTILMFHGNAGAIEHRVPIAKYLDQMLSCNILMLEYRGYGLSTGSPDEKGLQIDAQAGLDWIRKHEETRNDAILIYGQSLGGAVAIQLVANNQKQTDIKGLILENTFLSIRKMIPRYAAPRTERFLLIHSGACSHPPGTLPPSATNTGTARPPCPRSVTCRFCF